MSLTHKQEVFCREYLVDHNGAQAAIRAGYSEKTARNIASQLLAKPAIKGRVEALEAETCTSLGVTPEMVIEGLLIAANDHDAPASSRVAAYAHLGKYLGMFTDKVEQTNETRITEIKRVIIGKDGRPTEG